MYINDEQLRSDLKAVLLTKTRNQVVNEIKATGEKMHQFQIDKFLIGRPVSIETINKFDRYISKLKK
jgi:uncharacterized protein involved in tolerance to divalent cations